MITCRIPYGKPNKSHNILTKEALLNALKESGVESTNITDDYVEVEIDNFIEEEAFKNDRNN